MRAEGQPPAPAAVQPDPRVLPRLLATVGRPGLDEHTRQWGRLPRGGPALVRELGRSGLSGRGGAAFPTGVKWASVSGSGPAVIVANGTEGEPASNKDKALLLHAPHLVLDGMALAAESLGALESVLCLEAVATSCIRAVRRALAERSAVGADTVPVRLEAVPAGYVSGEETALVRWLNGGEAKPTFGHRPFEKGVAGRPTLVNNVETFAHAALIGRFGAGWFRALGTEAAPGSTLVTVLGDVARPAVYEQELGTPLSQVTSPAGPVGAVQAMLIGGYSGTWLPATATDRLVLDGQALRRAGAGLGCGSIAVLGERCCGLKTVAALARWMAVQSAGQCGPCRRGLPEIADAVDRLVGGGPRSGRWGPHLDRLMWMVDGRGACRHPDGTVHMVRSGLATFAGEIDWHSRHGSCGSPPLALPLPG